jgi:predicted DCC family thiol-disulfide oxidoreductase YuxK
MQSGSERLTKPYTQWLLYDGQCPFCSRYIKLLRLRQSIGEIDFIDARNGDNYLVEVQHAGLDINEGMVLKYGGKLYHGDSCIHMLALLTSPIGIANKINAWLFKSPTRARILYPWLRYGRNTVLMLLDRKKLQ